MPGGRPPKPPKPLIDGKQECTKCGQLKPLCEFYKNKNHPYGHEYRCKCCSKKAGKQYRKPIRENRLKQKFNLSRMPEQNTEKLCHDCGQIKLKSEFYKNSSTKDGLCGYCKSCDKRRCKEYRDGPAHDQYLEKKRQYYKDNVDAIKAQKAIYRERTREHKREHDRKYYKENKKILLEKQKEYAMTRPAAVYKITNKITGRTYIGQSKGYEQRWRMHLSDLRLNKARNPRLQRDYNLHGKDNFEFSVVTEYPWDTPSNILIEQEKIELLKYIRDDLPLYNSQLPRDNGDHLLDVEMEADMFQKLITNCKEANQTITETIKGILNNE